jgi:hypothetical protein
MQVSPLWASGSTELMRMSAHGTAPSLHSNGGKLPTGGGLPDGSNQEAPETGQTTQCGDQGGFTHIPESQTALLQVFF